MSPGAAGRSGRALGTADGTAIAYRRLGSALGVAVHGTVLTPLPRSRREIARPGPE
ncbi:hypothetical protein ABZT02_28295 [Streptomyces sp. NPDC005402]|uniref:hypothetical protein n=1 Tax=Streptomyces sp. NPDC005402 TaxID=3155338 RepID=UPI0033BF5324